MRRVLVLALVLLCVAGFGLSASGESSQYPFGGTWEYSGSEPFVGFREWIGSFRAEGVLTVPAPEDFRKEYGDFSRIDSFQDSPTLVVTIEGTRYEMTVTGKYSAIIHITRTIEGTEVTISCEAARTGWDEDWNEDYWDDYYWDDGYWDDEWGGGCSSTSGTGLFLLALLPAALFPGKGSWPRIFRRGAGDCRKV